MSHGARNSQARSVDRPALPGLELGAGSRVLTQELRQRPQQPAEVGAADLAREAQRLDDPIPHRVGKRAFSRSSDSPKRPLAR